MSGRDCACTHLRLPPSDSFLSRFRLSAHLGSVNLFFDAKCHVPSRGRLPFLVQLYWNGANKRNFVPQEEIFLT